MLDNKEILYESLANHIYFGGSIRSFCTTIGLTFFKNNQDYIDKAISLGYRATDIINQAILLMDKELANDVLNSDVYITPYTKKLDLLTQKLFNVSLLIQIDKDIELLKNRGNIVYNDELINKIDNLNDLSLKLINDFKEFCSDIKTKIDNNELFSYSYPDFFNYMYDEISVYGRDIERIKSKKDYTKFYLDEYMYYFNELLRESALYIRGLLDTKYQDIFDMASYYVNSFSSLSEKYLKNKKDLSIETERLINNYKLFINDIIDKLLLSKISFITPPNTLDNFLTNINAYLFLISIK